MNIETELKKAGYRKFPRTVFTNADCLYQIAVCDEFGIRYHVNFDIYHNLGYSAQVQFTNGECPTVNIEIVDKIGIAESEALFAKMWLALGKPYYERKSE